MNRVKRYIKKIFQEQRYINPMQGTPELTAWAEYKQTWQYIKGK